MCFVSDVSFQKLFLTIDFRVIFTWRKCIHIPIRNGTIRTTWRHEKQLNDHKYRRLVSTEIQTSTNTNLHKCILPLCICIRKYTWLCLSICVYTYTGMHFHITRSLIEIVQKSPKVPSRILKWEYIWIILSIFYVK